MKFNLFGNKISMPTSQRFSQKSTSWNVLSLPIFWQFFLFKTSFSVIGNVRVKPKYITFISCFATATVRVYASIPQLLHKNVGCTYLRARIKPCFWKSVRHSCYDIRQAVVVAQLVERSLPTPEVHSSNPFTNINEQFFINSNLEKRKRKEK